MITTHIRRNPTTVHVHARELRDSRVTRSHLNVVVLCDECVEIHVKTREFTWHKGKVTESYIS